MRPDRRLSTLLCSLVRLRERPERQVSQPGSEPSRTYARPAFTEHDHIPFDRFRGRSSCVFVSARGSHSQDAQGSTRSQLNQILLRNVSVSRANFWFMRPRDSANLFDQLRNVFVGNSVDSTEWSLSVHQFLPEYFVPPAFPLKFQDES